MPESPYPSVSTAPAQNAPGEARDELGADPANQSEPPLSDAQPDADDAASAWSAASAPEWQAGADWSAPSHVTVNGASPWVEQSGPTEAWADAPMAPGDSGHAVAGGFQPAAAGAAPGMPPPAGYATPQAGGVPAHARSQHRTVPPRGPRRARLQLRHIDPWTVLKFSCVLSVALFFVWLITIGVLYGVLDVTGAIGKINDAVTTINGTGSAAPITPGIVFGGAAIVGVVNIILFIALSTIGAVVYNLCADLVGGIEITLAERET
jgi:Transmembrane domain of unknown function (DUF3566)